MIFQTLAHYTLYIAVASAVLSIICLILAIVAVSGNRRMKRRLQQWKDISTTADLEEVFASTKQAVASIRHQVMETEQALQQLEDEMKRKVSTPQIQRYNAFAEVGSDLSYSVALLDEEGDGVVLTSIYGRDDSVTYGKPVNKGDSNYLLTTEEKAVIKASLRKGNHPYEVKSMS
ncbi:DUF4446 family protein [Alicyclobacillus dauci]|uniref:DUF4446 family protein n=1 Tax=Alicyclobacillus dauci TaxID=1475485 RepID=A0ABY6Z2V0_9BACL|nr:DUF4446 family protein [Alicyclobacillus dauci]WAH36997.1 DUF4446 family protein [Alicyclobacillus dauci]